MRRSNADVVVPFLGSADALREVLDRLDRLELADGDTVTVVDNSPSPRAVREEGMRARVVAAPEVRSPGYARNRGAGAGRADWIVFLDADVDPAPDLLDRYLDPAPPERTGVLAGGVDDRPGPGPAGRYAALAAPMDQEHSLALGRYAYAKTVNCAIRRAAFDEVGGFEARARAGEDADLCFRLAERGWQIERRYGARVAHEPRGSVRALLRQQFNHGSGAAWAARRHPGAFPAPRWWQVGRWGLRRIASALAASLRGDRDELVRGGLDALCSWSFELGRLRSNLPR